MTPVGWIDREIAEHRLDAKPDAEVLATAAAMIRARGNPEGTRRKRRKGSAR